MNNHINKDKINTISWVNIIIEDKVRIELNDECELQFEKNNETNNWLFSYSLYKITWDNKELICDFLPLLETLSYSLDGKRIILKTNQNSNRYCIDIHNPKNIEVYVETVLNRWDMVFLEENYDTYDKGLTNLKSWWVIPVDKNYNNIWSGVINGAKYVTFSENYILYVIDNWNNEENENRYTWYIENRKTWHIIKIENGFRFNPIINEILTEEDWLIKCGQCFDPNTWEIVDNSETKKVSKWILAKLSWILSKN